MQGWNHGGIVFIGRCKLGRGFGEKPGGLLPESLHDSSVKARQHREGLMAVLWQRSSTRSMQRIQSSTNTNFWAGHATFNSRCVAAFIPFIPSGSRAHSSLTPSMVSSIHISSFCCPSPFAARAFAGLLCDVCLFVLMKGGGCNKWMW
jgi:hypothetical protein